MKRTLVLFLLFSQSSFAQVNLSHGLIAYYPFNGNANDASGNGLNGIPRNGVQLTADRFGNRNSAYYFDGIDDYIEVLDDPKLRFRDSFSICMLFNRDPTGNSTAELIEKRLWSDGSASSFDFGLVNGQVRTAVKVGDNCPDPLNGWIYPTVSNTVNTNEWYCVVTTFKQGQVNFYLDGSLIGTGTTVPQIDSCVGSNMRIGIHLSFDLLPFKGTIDEVRIYNRAINQQEISALCTTSSCEQWLATPSQPSYVDIGDLDVPGNKITVEALLNSTLDNNGFGDIVSKHSGAADVNYLLRPYSGEITTTNGYYKALTNCRLLPNKTYHVAMVYDGASLKFYRNGFLLAQTPASGNLVLNDWHTWIGFYQPQALNENFTGYINEVRIWNVARTQAQIRANMNTSLPSPTTQTGLLAYYIFNNLQNKQGNTTWNGTLGGSAAINQTNPNCNFIADSCDIVAPTTANFVAPDTVCINTPVQIANTSVDATNYYWNFCVANANSAPTGVNMGNVGGQMQKPVYIDYAYDNGNYYGFISNNYPQGLLRLDFGSSLLNTPTVTALGSFGGIIPQNAEGLQVVKNESKWYVIILGGDPIGSGVTSRIAKIELGTNIANNSPVATDWGNLGNLSYPHDLYVFDDNGNWYGFTVNYGNNTVTRFNFSSSFSNTPTATNLGNIGNLSGPTGLHAIKDNNNWYVFITNATSSSLSRLDFGNSLLNTPTGQNVGNINGLFHTCWDIYVMKFCGEIVAFVINANQSYNDLVRLNFTNSITSTPTAVSLGNIGNCLFPHCLSKIFRVGADLYSFITNVDNNTLTRLQFSGCTNSNIPNSALQTPPPITYNTPGVYNINLSVDDGLPTQTTYCKQIVVTSIDSVRIRDSAYGCSSFDFNGAGYSYPINTWQWNFGDGVMAASQNTNHTYSSTGTYTVKLAVSDIHGCRDSISKIVTTINRPDFDFNYEINQCDPLVVQFAGIGSDSLNTWWSFGDGTILTGNVNPSHAFPAPGTYVVRYAVANGTCKDTLTKTVILVVAPDDLVSTPDTTICFGSTKQLKTKPVLSFCWKPTTYLDNPNSPNPVTSASQNITYYFTAQMTGQNLIKNGDFSNGNFSFTSEYRYSNVNTTEGEYFTGTNPSAWNGALAGCKDHTSAAGNMLMVNGSPTLNQYAWRQTVTVLPNTNYAFSTWIQGLISTNPAQLQFSINGKDLGNLINASSSPCTWTQFYTTWNSGSNTTATISIVNKNIIRQGNDFALDDISFAPVFTRQDSVVISIEKPVVKGFGDTTVCPGIQVPLNASGTPNYSWSPSAGLNKSSIANPVATPNSTTQYIVTGTSVNGCQAKDTVSIAVYPKPAITKSNDALICKNSFTQLFATGGNSYSWSPSASLSSNSISNPVANPSSNTVYHVTVTDANSCTNTDSIKVTIRPDPIFWINDPTNLCVNNSVQLNASGGDVYAWQPSGSLNSSSISDPMASPQATTNYSVVITDTVCNNTSTLTTTITVVSLPIVKASKSNDLDCNNDHSQLNATGATQYAWSPAGTLNNSQIANPVANPTTTTLYTVTGTDGNGCENSDSVTVKLTDANKSGYFMASAFTPNNDGLNDCYGIKYWGVIQELDFGIYNRWGERIFHTTTPGACWDGTYKGVKQNPDVYVYLITAKTFCGKVFKKGTFALIR
jgi:gliding motility-associated-like protein